MTESSKCTVDMIDCQGKEFDICRWCWSRYPDHDLKEIGIQCGDLVNSKVCYPCLLFIGIGENVSKLNEMFPENKKLDISKKIMKTYRRRAKPKKVKARRAKLNKETQ